MLSLVLATARTWAEIDVDKLLSNYHSALSELSPGTRHYTVLKADAYGLGAVPIAKLLYAEGARLFAMACVLEGVELKAALPQDAEVLIMGETAPAEIPLLLQYGLVPTVFSCEGAARISAMASERGCTAIVHCKVDTGLNRLGFSRDDAAVEIAKVAALPNLRVVGLFTHLQRRSPAHDRLQSERLLKVRDDLKALGIDVPMLHMLDSIGMWRYPEFQFDAVRDGAFVFGHTPADYPRPERIQFALSLKTRILRVFDVPAGECLGYDATHPLEAPRRVATLAVGYGDGYPRAMSFAGQVEIHGKRATVLGVVCMDLMMVDVTDIPEAAVGDIATLLGGGIHVYEYAAFSGGYANETLTRIGRRVPRVYIKGGKVVDIYAQQWHEPSGD